MSQDKNQKKSNVEVIEVVGNLFLSCASHPENLNIIGAALKGFHVDLPAPKAGVWVRVGSETSKPVFKGQASQALAFCIEIYRPAPIVIRRKGKLHLRINGTMYNLETQWQEAIYAAGDYLDVRDSADNVIKHLSPDPPIIDQQVQETLGQLAEDQGVGIEVFLPGLLAWYQQILTLVEEKGKVGYIPKGKRKQQPLELPFSGNGTVAEESVAETETES